MRIGIIVDGLSEVRGIPTLYERIRPPHTLVATVKADLQPLAPAGQIALRAAARCEVLTAKQPDVVLVLLDLETRTECPGELAVKIERLIRERLADPGFDVRVVFKVRRLENWLVADIECLGRSPALFPEARRVAQAIPAGNSDGIDALRLLQQASGNRRAYDKVRGAQAICASLDSGRAALNSRSFRRFLRVLGDSRYAEQSRLPNRDH